MRLSSASALEEACWGALVLVLARAGLTLAACCCIAAWSPPCGGEGIADGALDCMTWQSMVCAQGNLCWGTSAPVLAPAGFSLAACCSIAAWNALAGAMGAVEVLLPDCRS